MAKVVPAIQVTSAEAFREKIRLVRQLANRYQLDVIDPDFADVATVDPADLAPAQGLICDVHIMSPHPKEYIQRIQQLKPNLVIIQYEPVEDIENTIHTLADRGVPLGLAINPATEVADIAELLSDLRHVLIMGYPAGPSGRKLQPGALRKVAELRALKQSLEIGLDGGVAEDVLSKIAKADFDVVNVTTYLFDAPSPLDRYSELMEALG